MVTLLIISWLGQERRDRKRDRYKWAGGGGGGGVCVGSGFQLQNVDDFGRKYRHLQVNEIYFFLLMNKQILSSIN